MLGVFCALDMFLFYVFWEVMLVPMYFLIGIWGGARRLYAAIKFFLYTLVGSVVMLLGHPGPLLPVAGSCPGFEQTGTFDVDALVHDGRAARPAVLGASWPSSWASRSRCRCSRSTPGCPTRTCEAPTAGSVILAGVLLKMGTYGFIRFSLPLPAAARPAAAGPDGAGLDGAARHHRHRLRGARHARAEGHEEADRLLVGQPPRLRACWACSR